VPKLREARPIASVLLNVGDLSPGFPSIGRMHEPNIATIIVLPAPVRARESWIWLHCLIMLFAVAACKPIVERETLETSDACQRRVSGVPRLSACKTRANEKENDHTNPRRGSEAASC
jgi:hypothetical protein